MPHVLSLIDPNPPPLLPRDHRAYHEYMDDMNNSQGFYVTGSEYPIIASVQPVEETGGYYYGKAEMAAKFAVEEQNKRQESLLKFKKIIRHNWQPTAGALYYITMAAEDSSGEIGIYEAKVWEKLNSGYALKIFRPAPYWIKSSDKLSQNLCCIGLDTFLFFDMDESYLYYKCFYREVLGVEIVDREERNRRCILWFKNYEESEKFMKKYEGKRMPYDLFPYQFNTVI